VYSNRRAIISTHGYLDSDGSRISWIGGDRIWENLVVPHKNVFLVLCGHVIGEAERSDNLDNRTVYQLLSDYQGRSNGGNGWLRIMEFVPSENTIYVKTYSPYLNQYETDSDSQFQLTYPMNATVPGGVSVSITPSLQDNFPGRTLDYTVTVNNTGNVSDNYSLTVTDDAVPSWNPSVSPTSLSVSAGSSENVTLSVTIPATAENCTRDNITVTATSTDNTVKDNASCIARAILGIRRGVEVSISPDSQDNENGGTLTYTMTVRNTGNVTEDYDLTVDDDAGWTPTLPATVIGVIPDENRQVVLTVAIPATAENCTRDNITVTATSTENATIENSATCVAHCLVSAALPPPGGVQVAISENSKSGKPGDELSVTVVVTNTGTGTDTFSVTAEDTEDWALTVSPTSFSLNAGGSRNVGLSITIPSTAADDDSTTITVTATGTGYENSAICTAAAQAATDGVSPVVYVGAAVVVIVMIIVVVLIVKPF
jgi:hypothetical protein